MGSRPEYQRAWKLKNKAKVASYNKAYYDRYKERERDKSRHRALLRRLQGVYNISLAEYQALVDLQKGRCAICERHPKKLVIDHCHTTGQVRGLLCHRCNQRAGMIDESEELLLRALRYTQKFKEGQ